MSKVVEIILLNTVYSPTKKLTILSAFRNITVCNSIEIRQIIFNFIRCTSKFRKFMWPFLKSATNEVVQLLNDFIWLTVWLYSLILLLHLLCLHEGKIDHLLIIKSEEVIASSKSHTLTKSVSILALVLLSDIHFPPLFSSQKIK